MVAWARLQVRWTVPLLALVLLAGLFAAAPPAEAALPAGFSETTAIGGLTNPTVVKFAADGRVFVAEKSGIIKVYDGLADSQPDVFADLRTQVHNFWDRGLLGLELHPDFPANPSVYVLYTHDAEIGGTAPKWGSPGGTSDGCPNPPGATNDGCVVSGRLSRLQATGNTAGAEQVLIEDWCQQYPSHSIGALAFGADGMLYVSAGDGASFNFTDYGQRGAPRNPCGDPPGGVGGEMAAPTAEGGALRSQDLRTPADPTSLDGAILRVDPATGAGVPGNPLFASADANARRIIGYGTRNPFRLTIRPGTNEVWFGDVGWNVWEEVNRLPDPGGAHPDNFGWPCYEGGGRQGGYDSAGLNICRDLYAAGTSAVVAPYYAYRHSDKVVAGETCGTGSSSVAGVAFSEGGSFPQEYRGALFFADYSRNCIWAMMPGADGLPDPADRRTFLAPAASPVNLEFGPDGSLYYADFNGGRIRRIAYSAANQPPTAVAAASPTQGPAPLEVTLDGTGSSDPDPGDTLSYAWDLDGDGAFDDVTTPTVRWTYAEPGRVTATLRVTDTQGATATDRVTITVDNTSPVASIDAPAAGTRWQVDDVLTFAGSATDEQDGPLPGSALAWQVILHHCYTPDNCHEHPLQSFTGAGGSLDAPDHEYPSYLEFRLTATDSGGATGTASLRLDPETTQLTLDTNVPGLTLALNGEATAAPLTREVIVGSRNSISAPPAQTLGGTAYEFVGWSDGGAASHDVVAPPSPVTYVATYRATEPNWQPHAKVNFQPSTAPAVTGHLVDAGAVYGDRGGDHSYGWNADNRHTRDRNSSRSADQRYDTLNHMQKPQNPDAVWEMAVPDGQYRVRVVSGDPSYTDSDYRVAVEGTVAVSGTPTSSRRWLEGTVEVAVTDGRLTIGNASGARNNKLNFVEISRLMP